MESGAARKLIQSDPMVLWFVARGSVLKGPYSSEELEHCLRRKEIFYLDFCWRQGFREWRPIAAISEFERRGSRASMPVYPTVEVPLGGADSVETSRSLDRRYVDRRQTTKSARRVHVALGASRRKSFSVYEWALAVIFAVVFCYVGVQTALSELSDRLSLKIQLLSLGVPQTLEDHNLSLPPEAWEPLYSARGYHDFMTDGSFAGKLHWHALLPVLVRGFPVVDAQGKVHMGDHTIVTHSDINIWVASQHHADPVYAQPVIVRGFLSAERPQEVIYHARGEPYLEGNLGQIR